MVTYFAILFDWDAGPNPALPYSFPFAFAFAHDTVPYLSHFQAQPLRAKRRKEGAYSRLFFAWHASSWSTCNSVFTLLQTCTRGATEYLRVVGGSSTVYTRSPHVGGRHWRSQALETATAKRKTYKATIVPRYVWFCHTCNQASNALTIATTSDGASKAIRLPKMPSNSSLLPR